MTPHEGPAPTCHAAHGGPRGGHAEQVSVGAAGVAGEEAVGEQQGDVGLLDGVPVGAGGSGEEGGRRRGGKLNCRFYSAAASAAGGGAGGRQAGWRACSIQGLMGSKDGGMAAGPLTRAATRGARSQGGGAPRQPCKAKAGGGGLLWAPRLSRGRLGGAPAR